MDTRRRMSASLLAHQPGDGALTAPRRVASARCVRTTGAVAACLCLAACVGRSDRSVAEPSGLRQSGGAPVLTLSARPVFEVVDTVVIPAGTSFPESGPKPLGGLSAITPGPTEGEYLVVSDEESSPRLLRLRVTLDGSKLRVEPQSFQTIAVPPADRSEGAATDFEGLVCTRKATCFLSSEGNQESEPRLAPSLIVYRNDRFAERLSLPEKFRPVLAGPPTRGVRRNEGFEGLTLSRDGRQLVAALESSLAQDGDRPSPSKGALARVLVFDAKGGSYAAGAEHVYPIDAVRVPDGYEQPVGSNGLVEILPLQDGAFLTMERAFVREAAGGRRSLNHIVLYRTSFEGATDVRDRFSVDPAGDVRPMSKTLVLSLASLSSQLPQVLTNLENFEGMAPGPRLANGDQTLLLVSDDNFSKSQVTAFVLLRVVR